MRLTPITYGTLFAIIFSLSILPQFAPSDSRAHVSLLSAHPIPEDSTYIPPPSLSAKNVQQRLSDDIAAGKPVVVHITVALCDNVHQGIVPVPKKIGNGQDPTNNLYWGAAYGVRSYMINTAGYKLLKRDTLSEVGILERIILYKQIKRSGKPVDLYLVADAWDGSKIQEGTWRFLSTAAGYLSEELEVPVPGKTDSTRTISAGGRAPLLVYVGHNGLMDFRFDRIPVAEPTAPPRSTIILACASRSYFLEILKTGGSYPLLLTTNLMAPEAYSLEAAISSFVKNETLAQLHENVAVAYNTYQKCGMKGARNLFAVGEE